MFGRSRPATFHLYGKPRSRFRLPGWLLWWLFGAAVGAAGVVYVQERHLPPRLSFAETQTLREAYAQADAERLRLRSAEADRQRLSEELAASQSTVADLRQDLDATVDALPPDPRGGTVEVRVARFENKGDKMTYEVVLSRTRDTAKPLNGVMQLTVEGDPARGSGATVPLPPVNVSIGPHAVLRGALALPEGMKARQTTIQVLDKPAGRQLGMRVLPVH